MSTKLVIFDLDGTLLDTIETLSMACNNALALNGFPMHPIPDYCQMIGNGIAKLVERAMPQESRSESNINGVKGDFVRLYTQNISLGTKPYDGVDKLLCDLESMGIILAVASNKFQSGTEELVSYFFGERNFLAVCGNMPAVPLKPDPTIVEKIIEKAGVSKADVIYIGDSGVDMQTARNAGIKSIGVSWGLRDVEELKRAGADIIIHHPSEVLDYV